MKQNRKLWGVVATIAALALLVGGTTIASNMGFKFVPNIGANSYFNLSLPWNNNYAKAVELFNDLPGAQSIFQISATNTRTAWFNGAASTQNFDIVKGEGYVVQAGGSGVTTAVVVGSHDPNFTLDFAAGEYSNVASPYHQTHTQAVQLFTDLNAQLGATAIQSIFKIESNDTQTAWFNGAASTQNFSLDLGMAVLVQAGDGGTGYVWPHY